MKNFIRLSVSLVLLTVITKTSIAQRPPSTVCFTDAFGYKWTFSNITMTSATTYYGEGTVQNAYPSGKATIWVDISNGASNASVEVHGINAANDGCTQYSDSFVYVGSANITHGSGYSGSGSWTSYCFGGVINAGSWSASGPCGSGTAPKVNTGGITPTMSASKAGKKASTINTARPPLTVCFTDGFGYKWTFSNITMTSATSYYAEGTLTGAYPAGKATIWVDVSNGASNASVEVHGINAANDGCTQYSDSFVYVGSADITHGSGYTGSGSWTSYCFGGVINAGTWSAAGPCGSGFAPKVNTGGIAPAMSASKAGKAASKTAPRAPLTACFTDAFGYRWTFSNISMTSPTTYYAEGTLSGAYPSGKATLWVDVSNGANNASVELHGINANSDGCTQYSDSFVYVGSANITHGSGYTGSGSWTSYCFGGVINAGTWSASGPCGSGSLQTIKTNGAMPAQAGSLGKTANMLHAVPNPLKNSTQLNYIVANAGKVNVTIYNYMHQPVKVLVNEFKAAGNYSASWNALNSNGTRVPAGLYQVVMTSGDNKVHTTTVQVL